MASKFKLVSGGVEELLKGSFADSICRPEAEQILARARSTAPVKSGAYRDGLHIVEETHKTRKAFHVLSSVDYAAAVEADTGNLARSI